MLMSLLESFKTFCLNYTMSKKSYSLAELLKELQAAEGIVGHPKRIMQVMENGSSSSYAKKRKKEKMAPKQATQSKKQNPFTSYARSFYDQ